MIQLSQLAFDGFLFFHILLRTLGIIPKARLVHFLFDGGQLFL